MDVSIESEGCCNDNCESYKHKTTVESVDYPLNDKVLLQKGLDEIPKKDWFPTTQDKICSAHFKLEDTEINWDSTQMLKPNAIPKLFPCKTNISDQDYSHVASIVQSDQRNEINKKIKAVQLYPVTKFSTQGTNSKLLPRSSIKLKPVTQSYLSKILPNSNMKTANNGKVPFDLISPSFKFVSEHSTSMNYDNSNCPKMTNLNYATNGTCINNYKMLHDGGPVTVSVLNKNIELKNLTVAQPTVFLPLIHKKFISSEHLLPNQTNLADEMQIITSNQNVPKVYTDLPIKKMTYNKLEYCQNFEDHLSVLAKKYKQEQQSIKQIKKRIQNYQKYAQTSGNNKDKVKSNSLKGPRLNIFTKDEDEYETLLREVKELKQEAMNTKLLCKSKPDLHKKMDLTTNNTDGNDASLNILVSSNTPVLSFEDGEIVGEIPEIEDEITNSIDEYLNTGYVFENDDYIENEYF